MLRILHAIQTVNPAYGGPLEGVRQISRINSEYGHIPEIVSLDSPDDPWVGRVGLKVHAMGPSFSSYRYTPRLAKWLRENRSNYDVVIVNGIWAYNAFGVWRALRDSDVPYYVYTHGMLDPWFKYRYPLKHLKKWLFWPWAVYPVLRDARGVFFTCEIERLLARQSFWLYDCNEIVVSYGTPGVADLTKDYAKVFLNKYPDLVKYRRFIFLGRVHPKKAPDIIIRTLAQLKVEGQWDEGSMKLIMAGPSDGDYAAKLQHLAEKLSVSGSIFWTGMLLGDEKWGALQCAEAFLLPSHQENFGIAVAESLSVGVPVLISRSVNIWAEIVEDGAGFASDDTVADFSQVLRKWLSLSAAERFPYAKRARSSFENRFTSKRAAVSMLTHIYQVFHAERSIKSLNRSRSALASRDNIGPAEPKLNN